MDFNTRNIETDVRNPPGILKPITHRDDSQNSYDIHPSEITPALAAAPLRQYQQSKG